MALTEDFYNLNKDFFLRHKKEFLVSIDEEKPVIAKAKTVAESLMKKAQPGKASPADKKPVTDTDQSPPKPAPAKEPAASAAPAKEPAKKTAGKPAAQKKETKPAADSKKVSGKQDEQGRQTKSKAATPEPAEPVINLEAADSGKDK